MTAPLRTALAIAAFASAGLVWAAAAAPGAPDPARVVAGNYKLEPGHTFIGWRVSHMGFNDSFGLFGSMSGTLSIDPANLAAAKVSVRIPVRKVVTANPGLTGALLRPKPTGKPDYFGPQPADARFVSTSVKPGSDGQSAAITGNLTLNGVTRPVTLNAQFIGAGKNPLGGALTVGFHATAAINRSDFGISADIPLVADRVDLEISAAFEKTK